MNDCALNEGRPFCCPPRVPLLRGPPGRGVSAGPSSGPPSPRGAPPQSGTRHDRRAQLARTRGGTPCGGPSRGLQRSTRATYEREGMRPVAAYGRASSSTRRQARGCGHASLTRASRFHTRRKSCARHTAGTPPPCEAGSVLEIACSGERPQTCACGAASMGGSLSYRRKRDVFCRPVSAHISGHR